MQSGNPKIKNGGILAKNPLRQAAVEIIEAGLQAIDTKYSVSTRIKYQKDTLFIDDRKYPLEKIKRVFVVGVGKCSLEAALALEDILGDRLEDGIVIDLKCETNPKKIKFYKGDHPLPTENNVNLTRQLIEFLEKAEKDDLVLFLISGGGSALLCQPNNFNFLAEKNLMSYLMKSGANIRDVNIVRKHLSLARGGFLAKYVYPARSIALIFSDVGNDMEFVASGPTIKDTTTIEDAKKVLIKYGAEEFCNFDLENLTETPKDDKYFEKMENKLFLSNLIALREMANRAEKLGFKTEIKTTKLEGEARDIGEQIAREINESDQKIALIYGGETTVTVKTHGKGGRNQELALSALRFIEDDCLVAAVNSDGWDNTDFAGALCDNLTREKANELGLDVSEYLDKNQSYNFFEKVGDYFRTGLTNSNIADLLLALKNRNNE